MQVSANPGKTHSGGLCFGDSGGPILYKGEIVAVNSFVLNLQCMGNGFAQRTDNTRDLEWIRTAEMLGGRRTGKKGHRAGAPSF